VIALLRRFRYALPVRRRDPAARRATGAALLAFYALIGLAAPVAHAQHEAGRPITTHIESQSAPCDAHDELSCSICRLTVLAIPGACGAGRAAAPQIVVTSRQPSKTPFVAGFAGAPLGARAPPLR
jgi:hypothetical protein